jgi:hypothetical protein
MAIRLDLVLCDWSNLILSFPCAVFIVQPGPLAQIFYRCASFSVCNNALDDPVLFLLLLLALFVEQKRLGIFLRKTRGIEAGLIYLVGLDVIIDTL